MRSRRRPIAWCLEPHDLVLAKCVAGRERDWDFARHAVAAGIVSTEVLLLRVTLLPVSDDVQQRIRRFLAVVSDS